MNKNLSLRFLVISLVFHIVFISSFVFAYSFKRVNKRFVVYGAPEKSFAYFKPLRVARSKSGFSGGTKFAGKKSRTTKKRKPLPKKKITNKSTKKTTLAKSKKPVVKKTIKPNVVQKKKSPAITSLKEKTTKKIEQNLAKKTVEKKLLKDEKKVEKKIEKPKEEKKHLLAQKEEVKKVEDPKKEEIKDLVEEEQEGSLFDDGEEISFVLGEDVDPKYISFLNSVQREISRVWHPPINLPKDAECVVDIIPGFGDVIKSFEIVKPSNIKAFNSSVKIAVPRMKFPKELHGQRLSITFKQWC